MKKLWILCLLSYLLSGCSVFQSSRKMDITPFADNTRVLFTEAIKIEQPFPWKHLKEETEITEFQIISEKAKPVIEVLHSIIFYSNQVVAIYNSTLSEKSKALMLADYLDEAMQKALEREKADSVKLDLARARSILINIRNADTYFNAMAAAEPIIHSVVSATMERIDSVQALIPPVLSGFTREIEKDYAVVKINYLRLQDLQEKLMLSVTRLYYARLGNKVELLTLLDENPSLKYFIPSLDQASYENMRNAENYLLDQIKEVDLMITQLDEKKREYRAEYDEVIAWKNSVDEKILVARASLAFWARAHKNLGTGIPVPPLIDVAGITSSLAGSAVKTVVP